jgi:hypothetical protein
LLFVQLDLASDVEHVNVTGYILREACHDLSDEVESLARFVAADGNQQALGVVIVLGYQLSRTGVALRVPVVEVDLMPYERGGHAREHPLNVPPSHLGDTDQQVRPSKPLLQSLEVSAAEESRALVTDWNPDVAGFDSAWLQVEHVVDGHSYWHVALFRN